MRIAQVATLGSKVAARGSGSIEFLVWLLARSLTEQGHEVTVFGAEGSDVPGELVSAVPGPYAAPGTPGDWQLCEWLNLCRAVEEAERFDVIHCHAYLWGVPLQRLSAAPLVHTLHTLPSDDHRLMAARIPPGALTALSSSQWSVFPDVGPLPVVHHGVAADGFTFRATPDEYVCYLGRFLPEKGPIEAIDAARRAGVRIVLAGPENTYFRAEVAPLVDGDAVRYAGSVTAAARDELLGGARALVYPLQAAEPFGLVLIEAMMCGTPVVATPLGAVPEIVDEGITGLTAASPKALAEAVDGAASLDRAAVRERAVERFSASRMARAYVAVYETLLEAACV